MAGSQSAWGLDVGTTSLKAIKLRRDGDKVAVEAFDVIEHDKFLSEPEVDRDDLIRHTLRKFLEQNPLKGEAVFVGVPGSSTFARFVKLPPVDPKKIPEIVRFEAIQQIPFPLDQVNWDYQTFLSPDSPDVEVGIFAMKKELVAQVLANFRSTGMTVQGVQMSPLAVYNAASYDGLTDGKGTVLIDMGAEHTDLVIMDQGRLWLRTINIGGNHFTDALAKSFKQSFTRAESLKKSAATSKYQKQIFQAMRPIFADLVAEVQRSIGHYNSSHRDSKLERIVGMGNPFKLPNLQKYLQQELKMEVVRLDNFRKVVAEGKLAAGLNDTILSMTSAYGLAIQGLGLASIDTNLLPVEIARQMMWQGKRPWFIGAAACMVVVAGVWQAQYWNANAAFGSQASKEKRAENTEVIAAAMRAAQSGPVNTFAADKTIVDNYLRLGEDRSLMPAIMLDFLGALPQAQGNAHGGPAAGGRAGERGSRRAATEDRTIVVTSITSTYTDKLRESTTNSAEGETSSPSRMQTSPTSPMSPMSPEGEGSAGGGGGGEADRGFLVTISGYVSPSATGVPGNRVVNEYQSALLARAKKGSGKPFYFADARVASGEFLRAMMTATPSSSDTGLWGSVKGPFWDEFAPEIVGVKLDEKVATNGETDVLPAPSYGMVDLFATHLPGTPPPMLTNAFQFTLRLKVFLTEDGGQGTPAVSSPGPGMGMGSGRMR